MHQRLSPLHTDHCARPPHADPQCCPHQLDWHDRWNEHQLGVGGPRSDHLERDDDDTAEQYRWGNGHTVRAIAVEDEVTRWTSAKGFTILEVTITSAIMMIVLAIVLSAM